MTKESKKKSRFGLYAMVLAALTFGSVNYYNSRNLIKVQDDTSKKVQQLLNMRVGERHVDPTERFARFNLGQEDILFVDSDINSKEKSKLALVHFAKNYQVKTVESLYSQFPNREDLIKIISDGEGDRIKVLPVTLEGKMLIYDSGTNQIIPLDISTPSMGLPSYIDGFTNFHSGIYNKSKICPERKDYGPIQILAEMNSSSVSEETNKNLTKLLEKCSVDISKK